MSTICVCGHDKGYHPVGTDGVDMGCFAGVHQGHICECDHFQQRMDSNLDKTWMYLFGRVPTLDEMRALEQCERWFDEIKQKRLIKAEPVSATLVTPAGNVSGTFDRDNMTFQADTSIWAGGPPANVLPGLVVAVDEAGMSIIKSEHDDKRTHEDRRPIRDRMKDGGVPLKELIESMYNDGEALAITLNGLYFLDMGSVQPNMGDDESTWVWDGSFVWNNGQMWYEGADGPGGGGHKARAIVVEPDTLIELY